jgi:5'-nucleotidase
MSGEAKPAETAATPDAATGETAAAADTPSAGGKHVIARGDTLWDIAKTAYGDGTLWRRIAEANGNPRPRALHVGTELSIPAE